MSGVGERLKKVRMALGMSQKEISDRFGLGESTWAKNERAGRLPKTETLSELADLGFSLDWLMTGVGDMRRAVKGGPTPVSAPDAHLLGRLTDGIVRLYKEMGQGIALHQAVEKAVELHDEIVSAIGPDDDGARAGAMALALSRLRTELRTAAANPAETKRLA